MLLQFKILRDLLEWDQTVSCELFGQNKLFGGWASETKFLRWRRLFGRSGWLRSNSYLIDSHRSLISYWIQHVLDGVHRVRWFDRTLKTGSTFAISSHYFLKVVNDGLQLELLQLLRQIISNISLGKWIALFRRICHNLIAAFIAYFMILDLTRLWTGSSCCLDLHFLIAAYFVVRFFLRHRRTWLFLHRLSREILHGRLCALWIGFPSRGLVLLFEAQDAIVNFAGISEFIIDGLGSWLYYSHLLGCHANRIGALNQFN